MSIINSDGKNTDWQLKVLKGLQNVATNVPIIASSIVSAINSGVATVVASISNTTTAVNNVNTTLSPEAKVTTIARPTTTGTIAAGANSVSIANVGTANGTVKGVTLKPGETVSFNGGALNNTLDEIAYVATGTEFLIITVV